MAAASLVMNPARTTAAFTDSPKESTKSEEKPPKECPDTAGGGYDSTKITEMNSKQAAASARLRSSKYLDPSAKPFGQRDRASLMHSPADSVLTTNVPGAFGTAKMGLPSITAAPSLGDREEKPRWQRPNSELRSPGPYSPSRELSGSRPAKALYFYASPEENLMSGPGGLGMGVRPTSGDLLNFDDRGDDGRARIPSFSLSSSDLVDVGGKGGGRHRHHRRGEGRDTGSVGRGGAATGSSLSRSGAAPGVFGWIGYYLCCGWLCQWCDAKAAHRRHRIAERAAETELLYQALLQSHHVPISTFQTRHRSSLRGDLLSWSDRSLNAPMGVDDLINMRKEDIEDEREPYSHSRTSVSSSLSSSQSWGAAHLGVSLRNNHIFLKDVETVTSEPVSSCSLPTLASMGRDGIVGSV